MGSSDMKATIVKFKIASTRAVTSRFSHHEYWVSNSHATRFLELYVKLWPQTPEAIEHEGQVSLSGSFSFGECDVRMVGCIPCKESY